MSAIDAFATAVNQRDGNAAVQALENIAIENGTAVAGLIRGAYVAAGLKALRTLADAGDQNALRLLREAACLGLT